MRSFRSVFGCTWNINMCFVKMSIPRVRNNWSSFRCFWYHGPIVHISMCGFMGLPPTARKVHISAQTFGPTFSVRRFRYHGPYFRTSEMLRTIQPTQVEILSTLCTWLCRPLNFCVEGQPFKYLNENYNWISSTPDLGPLASLYIDVMVSFDRVIPDCTKTHLQKDKVKRKHISWYCSTTPDKLLLLQTGSADLMKRPNAY